MADEEVLNLPCPFPGQKRADGIDEPSARPDQFGANVEQSLLKRNQPVEPIWSEPPAPFRIAPPSPTTRAGRIDENDIGAAVPFGEVVELSGWIEQPGFNARAGALGAWLQLREPRPVGVCSKDV